MMGKGMHVVGLEPGNCLVGGRAEERAAGRLSFMEPGSKGNSYSSCVFSKEKQRYSPC